MKLRNKKTGEIIELLAKPSFVKRNDDYLQSELNSFNSLTELNSEWEDYEEPKEWWYIDIHGSHKVTNNDEYYQQVKVASKEIGNYFDTREEAELAVRKLKAWKRLKDEYDFKFTGWKRDEQYSGDFIITAQDYWNTSDDKLLDLLFGAEE